MYSLQTSAGSFILWPFIVIILLAFLIWTEDGSQNLLNGRAHHRSPPIGSEDSPGEILRKTRIAINNRSTVVGWRRALITSLLIALILLFLVMMTIFPHGITIFLITTILFVGIYFMSIYLQYQYIAPHAVELDERLLTLTRRLKRVPTVDKDNE